METKNNNPEPRRVRGFKKSTAVLLDQLTALIGRKNWTRISSPCTGKWKGTIDYGVQFDDGLCHFISNGMTNFEENISAQISYIQDIQNNREKYLQILRDQALRDNAVAEAEGLYPVSVIDMGIHTESEHNFLWSYLILEVHGKRFKFIESGLNCHLKMKILEKWIEKCRKPIFTAGAVQNPDHIFGNVRFSSTDRLYKIYEITQN